MFHARRRWHLATVANPAALAEMLTQRTWTLCSAFCVTGHDFLFLNDSTHEDAAAEFAIVKRLPDGQYLQVESVTFSWMDASKALVLIQEALAGLYDGNDFARLVEPILQTPEKHGRCHHCA